MAHYLTILLLCAIVFGFVFAAPSAPKPCSTEACKRAAAYIIDGMNATANPCDNFYEYACGGWKEHHSIPESKSRTGTFDLLDEKMTKEIRQLLSEFNLNTDTKQSAGAVSYAAFLYQRCMELGNQSNNIGLGYLKTVVKSILGHDWSIGNKNLNSNDQWNTIYVRAMASGVSSFFSIWVYPNPLNVTGNVLSIDSTSFGLGDDELRNLTANAKDVAAYKDYIRSSAKLFCGQDCDQEQLEKEIDEIVNLESELAKNKLTVEQQRDPETMVNMFNNKQLHDKTNLDWNEKIFKPLLDILGARTVGDSNKPLMVTDVNYTVKAIEILQQTPIKTVVNYIGWRLVSHFGPFSFELFREINFKFNQVISGVKKISERNETCHLLANNYLDLGLSRLFIEHYFNEKAKTEATAMIDSIQKSFENLIQSNDWLDAETKKASLSKLNHVRKNVAYPSWLLKNDQLDEVYNLSPNEIHNWLSQENYLQTLLEFSKLQMKKIIVDFNKPVDLDKRWPMPPAIINAAYSPDQNSITIPAGILKFPFFDSERPYSINYGFIGVVVGHEFTHGLDDQGRQFDEMGNLHNWWTQDAVQRFHKRSVCFVDEYGNQVEPITKLNLNGKNTLGENIADNGGLHESYNAFKAREAEYGPAPTLADLPKLSGEQLFFISYANTWCSLIRPEKLKLQIEYDPHSPARYRVNVPTSNSVEFSKAFNCPIGSTMNPKDKCHLW